jgi:hypothetical protein
MLAARTVKISHTQSSYAGNAMTGNGDRKTRKKGRNISNLKELKTREEKG